MKQRTVELLIERLRRMADTQYQGKRFLLPEGAVSRLDLVERRLLAAIRRDETGTTERDGFPSGAGPGDGGEYAAQSTAEAAALSTYRLDDPRHPEQSAGYWGQQERDEHHAYTDAAANALERAADALSDLIEKLDAIDRLAHQTRTDPSGSCLVCSRFVEGTSVDRLRRGMCSSDYNAWVRAGRPELVEFKRMRQGEAA